MRMHMYENAQSSKYLTVIIINLKKTISSTRYSVNFVLSTVSKFSII